MEKNARIALIGVAAAMVVGVVLLFTVGQGKPGTAGGLNEGSPPWAPNYVNLAQRIRDLGLPSPGSERFHVHAQLRVYADGQAIAVPANIAFNPTQRVAAALHTHDTDGVVHLEADQPFTARLGDFFALWGVKFTPEQLGSFRNGNGKTVQVIVNGQPISNPESYAIQSRDKIVVGYGAPNSFPTTIAEPLPEGT